MRKYVFLLGFALLAGCVTVNVYFPAAAAQKAADQVIGNVMGPEGTGQTPASPASAQPAPSASTQPVPASGSSSGDQPLAVRVVNALVPAAYAAAPQSNLKVQTPAIEAIEARMRARFHSIMKGLLTSGAVGFTHNGNVAIHDASKIPLSQRAQANKAVADENADRAELYQQIATANGHPGWATRMRESFARQWISRAHPGWWYQDASGNWKQKK